MVMDYEHHIFISYAHGETWTHWVRNIFVPRLHDYLQLEMGRLEIFVDDQIQTGARWDDVLRRKIACSKIMLCLISADYFQREWCRREMALILERERQVGLEGKNENYGLIIPIRLGDGKFFPKLIGRIQYQDFGDYADPDLPKGTERASQFNQSINRLAKTIVQTLPKAPDFCDDWLSLTGEDFLKELEPLMTVTLPRLFV